jgi:branched-chain amino acid transport system ATP-binding protein
LEVKVATDRPQQLARAESITSGYGDSLVVRDVSVSAGQGEIVTIIGPNGSGKSTLLKTLAGMVTARSGHIWHGNVEVTGQPAEVRARRGIAYLPQEREVFASLTVRDNLLMGGFGLDRRALRTALERVHAAYPILGRLDKTLAGRLSGGERKTVAMARVMMSSPSVVLLDEPTANLAPIPSAHLLQQEIPALAAAGVAIVLVEQRAAAAIAVCDWVYVLVGGAVALQGRASDFAERDLGAVFLGGQAAAARGASPAELAGGMKAGEGATESDGSR